jgi:hypothetical protein
LSCMNRYSIRYKQTNLMKVRGDLCLAYRWIHTLIANYISAKDCLLARYENLKLFDD